MTTATARMTFLLTAMVLAAAIEATPTVVNGPRPQCTPSDLCLDDNDLNSKLFNCPPLAATCFVEKDNGRLKLNQLLPKTLPLANAMAKNTCGRENKLDTMKSCGLENSPTSIRPRPQSNGLLTIDTPVSFDPISTSSSGPPTRVITNGQYRDRGFNTVTDPKRIITQLKIKKKKEEKTTETVGQMTDTKEKKLNGASDIAKSRDPANDTFKNESNGTGLHVPVPTIHRSRDAMDPNVCQGLHQQKLYKQGKY